MNLLLDTCAFLWAVGDPARLTRKVRTRLEGSGAKLYLSAISGLEIAVKCKLGRLDIRGNVEETIADGLQRHGIDVLSVSMNHAVRAGELPLHHRDPFDRVLIAQADLEGLVVVTPDRLFSAYQVKTFW